jgi:membrane fusion protein (multidrug efflux system)
MSFEHTLRAVHRQRPRAAWILPGLILLGAWLAWMLRAELAVFATTTQARVEVSRMPSHVAAEAGGRVLRIDLELDRRVERGQELLVLESSIQEAELEQHLARLRILDKKRAGVESQLAAERAVRDSRARLAGVTRERASMGLRKAEAAASHQETLTRISETLRRDRINSEVDVLEANGELLSRQLAVADAATEIERLSAEEDFDGKSELARLAELGRQLVDVEVEHVATEAAIALARAELARRRVLAPVSGYIGHLTPLQRGDVVQAGQVVASIVPADDVRVVAHFPPSEAVGVIVPGQRARVRLDGFSWVEFGALEASVARIASEPLDGLIRVELSLGDDPASSAAPLHHGQTASVDVQTSVAAPWALVLRAAGAGLSRRSERAGEHRLARDAAP